MNEDTKIDFGFNCLKSLRFIDFKKKKYLTAIAKHCKCIQSNLKKILEFRRIFCTSDDSLKHADVIMASYSQ